MSESPEQAQTEPQESPRPKRMKTIILAAVILTVEAVLIIGVMTVAGKPDAVQAGPPEVPDTLPEEDRIVEVLILDTRLPNSRSGITYLYDTEIFIQVRKRDQQRVSLELEQFQNEIRSEITAIWRTSEPSHFQEPRLQTLTRKVGALLEERFGTDEQTGEPIVSKCVIVMGTGFRVDS